MFCKKGILFYALILLTGNSLPGMDVVANKGSVFEKIKEDLIWWENYPGNKEQSTRAQRRSHGYHGLLIPIVECPRVYRSGFIIQNAQHSKWWGFSYDDTCAPQDLILIAHEKEGGYFDRRYQARIKSSMPVTIFSCILFDKMYTQFPPNFLHNCLLNTQLDDILNSHLALLWHVNQQNVHSSDSVVKKYITTAPLAQIRAMGDELDLDKNKVEVKVNN